MQLYLSPALKPIFNFADNCFDEFMSLHGECFRKQRGRITQRVVLGGKSFFIKQHFGVGWREIFKNLMIGRLPVISAKVEWKAIAKLQTLSVNVPVTLAYGERGKNPAKMQSFVLLENLEAMRSLEDVIKTWQQESPKFKLKQILIREVARIARILHENGVNHRDFYLCHFLMDPLQEEPTLYLIDLHRAQIRMQTPLRSILKDLGGLYFSSLDAGLTARDYLRFIKAYRGLPLRTILATEKNFFNKAKYRGEQLYKKHQRR